MGLEAIAALLGHKTLAMTMVYARIADKTVADEYFAVTDKVEALYNTSASTAMTPRPASTSPTTSSTDESRYAGDPSWGVTR